jgi:hypothetical protein
MTESSWKECPILEVCDMKVTQFYFNYVCSSKSFSSCPRWLCPPEVSKKPSEWSSSSCKNKKEK